MFWPPQPFAQQPCLHPLRGEQVKPTGVAGRQDWAGLSSSHPPTSSFLSLFQASQLP